MIMMIKSVLSMMIGFILSLIVGFEVVKPFPVSAFDGAAENKKRRANATFQFFIPRKFSLFMFNVIFF